MDLQDVANLTIPEGSVKTIHDKDNRLLWGAVGYDTKYTGNTTQNGEPTPDVPVTVNVATGAQSIWLHGKNLFDKSVAPGTVSSGMSTEQLPTGIRAINDVVSESSSIRIAYYKICDLSKVMGKTITINVNMVSSSVNRPRVIIGFSRANFGNRTTKTTINASGSDSFVVDGVQSDQTILFLGLYSAIGTTGGDAPSGSYVDYTDLQIEIGNQATSYESFISPQTYTVDLGATELCEIGTYQDNIYKSGSDWYVHKEIQKLLVDGVNTKVSSQHNIFGGINGFRINISSVGDLGYTDMLSDNFNYIAWGTYQSSDRQYGEITATVNASTTIYVTQPNSTTGATFDSAGVTSMNTWFSNHNTLIYYVLANPTDTQITDATLIGQLNAVHEWLTRYGYNATVSGNLPLIVNRTNL